MTEAEMPRINRVEYIVLKGLDDKWEWIARDKDRSLYAFTEKPVKKYDPSPYWDTETGRSHSVVELIDVLHLFQFIQWGDKEPHSIAKLIKEYEFENVLSDNDPDKGLLDPKMEITEGHGMSESEWAEVIARYKWHLEQEGYIVIEKPTIPRFVAEYIDEKKECRISELIDSHLIYDVYDELARWLYYNNKKTNKERELSLVLAHRYGYELEKEKKYHAKIKGWENVTTGSEAFNWVYFKEKDTVGISKAVENKYQAVSFTKNDWNDLGINEHNADFVLEEENIK